jgi:hypothetical protein
MIRLSWTDIVAGKSFTDKDGKLHRITAQTGNEGYYGVYVDENHHARVERDPWCGPLKKAFEEVIASFIAAGWVETQTPKKFTLDYSHCQAPSHPREMGEDEIAYHDDLDLNGVAYDLNLYSAPWGGGPGRPTTFSEWVGQAEVSDAFEAKGEDGFTYRFERRE